MAGFFFPAPTSSCLQGLNFNNKLFNGMDAGEVTPNSQIHVGKKHKGLFTIRYYFLVLFLFSSFHFTVKNVKIYSFMRLEER